MSENHQRRSSLTDPMQEFGQESATTMPLLSSSVPLGQTDMSASSSFVSSSNNNSVSRSQVRYSFQKKPFVIGVAGGTASGKSTVCTKIIEKLGPIDPTSIYLSHEKRVVRISQDSFYRKLTEIDREAVNSGEFNFDHPSAFDVDLMVKTLRDVCDGKMVRVPVYDYNENKISDQEEIIYPADVVLFEGLLLFYFPDLRKLFHMKIFVDTDPDTRLARRVTRDVKERNRDLNFVLAQYLKFVKPSFEEFCLPSKKYADIVVPRGPDNEVAVDLIATQVRSVFDPTIRHQSIKFGYTIVSDKKTIIRMDSNDGEDCATRTSSSSSSLSNEIRIQQLEQDQLSLDVSEATTTTSDFSEPLMMMMPATDYHPPLINGHDALSSEDDDEEESLSESDIFKSSNSRVPRSRPVKICPAGTAAADKDFFRADHDDGADLGLDDMDDRSDVDSKKNQIHHQNQVSAESTATTANGARMFWVASR